ncbi:hypothetical protein [Leisingera sp. S232]|uniref:hypothetical protein n=1 Tax=Leisingera sp. S232 TaxID=3415132 RepID=UPI003C7BAAAE
MEQTLRCPFLPSVAGAAAGTENRPKPKPVRAPVFLQDAMTPWVDGILLLALWRLQQAEDQDSSLAKLSAASFW